MPGRTFAVLDGGHFDNVQPDLVRLGLEFRPLFTGGPELGALIRGPHLIAIGNGRQLDDIIALAAGQPALVFWAWPDGPGAFEQLHHHLRTINLVDVPRAMLEDRPDPDMAEPDHSHAALAKTAWETVTFRHADPRVLNLLLPLLRPEQIARFLGEGLALVLEQTNSPPRILSRPTNLPQAPRGRLQISADQYAELSGSRAGELAHTVAGYLRQNAPAAAAMDDGQLMAVSYESVRQATAMGVESLASHCRWAYMQLASGGQLYHDPQLRVVMQHRDKNLTADQRIDLMMRHAIQAARMVG